MIEKIFLNDIVNSFVRKKVYLLLLTCFPYFALFLALPQVSERNDNPNVNTLCQKLAFPGTLILDLSKVRNEIA